MMVRTRREPKFRTRHLRRGVGREWWAGQPFQRISLWNLAVCEVTWLCLTLQCATQQWLLLRGGIAANFWSRLTFRCNTGKAKPFTQFYQCGHGCRLEFLPVRLLAWERPDPQGMVMVWCTLNQRES